jgi:hypothetical protein
VGSSVEINSINNPFQKRVCIGDCAEVRRQLLANVVLKCRVWIGAGNGDAVLSGVFPAREVKKNISSVRTQISTSLSRRTFVRFRYDPCAKTEMLCALNVELADTAARMADSALLALSRAMGLGGCAHIARRKPIFPFLGHLISLRCGR